MAKSNVISIPYGKQWITRSDVEAVKRALLSERITQGPRIEDFERAFAATCGAPYAVAVSSGTAGLHLASLAAGFGPGDEVITSPITFVASANCILYAGAVPRFADIDRRTYCLDPSLVKKAVSKNTRGIVSVDFSGQPCVLGPKAKFSRKKDFTVIEDASHALGAEIKKNGKWVRIGACLEEDMTVFSFHPVKHITTGEGGMVTTRRRDLYEKLRLLRSHGIEKNSSRLISVNGHDEPWYYEMTALGFNYRITDIQCALGLSQLKRIDAIVKRRREVAAFYSEHLREVEQLCIPEADPDTRPSWHLYVLRIDFKTLGISRGDFMKKLLANGIQTQVHYIPITHQPYYRERYGFRTGDHPEAEAYYKEALSIPIFPNLKSQEMKKVVKELKKALAARVA